MVLCAALVGQDLVDAVQAAVNPTTGKAGLMTIDDVAGCEYESPTVPPTHLTQCLYRCVAATGLWNARLWQFPLRSTPSMLTYAMRCHACVGCTLLTLTLQRMHPSNRLHQPAVESRLLWYAAAFVRLQPYPPACMTHRACVPLILSVPSPSRRLGRGRDGAQSVASHQNLRRRHEHCLVCSRCCTSQH